MHIYFQTNFTCLNAEASNYDHISRHSPTHVQQVLFGYHHFCIRCSQAHPGSPKIYSYYLPKTAKLNYLLILPTLVGIAGLRDVRRCVYKRAMECPLILLPVVYVQPCRPLGIHQSTGEHVASCFIAGFYSDCLVLQCACKVQPFASQWPCSTIFQRSAVLYLMHTNAGG
jgi:hypothetical protein